MGRWKKLKKSGKRMLAVLLVCLILFGGGSPSAVSVTTTDANSISIIPNQGLFTYVGGQLHLDVILSPMPTNPALLELSWASDNEAVAVAMKLASSWVLLLAMQ
jgi:hypothetical protein